MHCSLLHRDQGVGNCTFSIVVGVNPERCSGKTFLNLFRNRSDLIRQRAAIRVTHYERIRPAIYGCLQSLDCIFMVCIEPVKKMLGIIDDFPTM